MVQITSRQRVDAFWANTLGVGDVEFRTAGTRVFPNPPQRSIWRGIYVLAFDTSACVFVPPDLIEAVSGAIVDAGIDTILEPATWRDMPGLTIASALGPVVHHYRDDPDGLDAMAEGRAIGADDTAAIDELRAAVPLSEWTSAGFADEPAMLFGIFDDDRLLAAANLTPGPDAATDVGMVVRPDARGQGHGLRIAATATQQAIVTHGIARFRVLATSQSTLALASKLGYEPYGRNLTAYLS